MTSSPFAAYNEQRECADKRSLCHAPSYGLHLSSNGLVAACSLTRFDSLGSYPQESLAQIWWGSRAKAMREAMRGDAFPAACNVCDGDLRAGQYRQMRAHAYDRFARPPGPKRMQQWLNAVTQGHAGEYPREMSFELSNTCNLECVMCLGLLSSSIRKNRDKLPPLPQCYGPELLPQLRAFIPHLQEASFYGGEPFLIDLYLDIWELFAELNPGCTIYITTNGTVLNNRIKAVLERLPNVQLVVSLDGITAQTFEGIRINARFSRVMENLQHFKQVCQKHGRRLVISPTYMRANWHEYPQLLDFANREDLVFRANVLRTPTELSLAYAGRALLEQVHDRWHSHEAAPAASPELAQTNRQAFDVATAQIAEWLQESREFEAHPRGAVLSRFVPQTRLESCLSHLLVCSLRRTQDPAVPLRLLELWAVQDPTPAVTYWQGVRRLAAQFLPDLPAPADQALVEYLASHDTARQLHVVQHMLVRRPPWQVFDLLEQQALGAIEEVFRTAAAAEPLPAVRAAFF